MKRRSTTRHDRTNRWSTARRRTCIGNAKASGEGEDHRRDLCPPAPARPQLWVKAGRGREDKDHVGEAGARCS